MSRANYYCEKQYQSPANYTVDDSFIRNLVEGSAPTLRRLDSTGYASYVDKLYGN